MIGPRRTVKAYDSDASARRVDAGSGREARDGSPRRRDKQRPDERRPDNRRPDKRREESYIRPRRIIVIVERVAEIGRVTT